MSIHQFNATWSNKEDRIELRFNTSEKEEFCFWITRFMAIQFKRLAEAMIGDELKKRYENNRTASVIQEFQKEQIKSSADFKSDYEGGDKRPLGDRPILLIGLSFTPKEKTVAIEFQLETKKNVNFQLSQEMLISLVMLLENLAEKAEWGLDQALATDFEQNPFPTNVAGYKPAIH